MTLFLDTTKPGKFQIGVRNETTVDAYKGCIPSATAARERHAVALLYISCVRLLRCPFNSNGQFQGLVVWDGQQVIGSHAFLFTTSVYSQHHADDVSPKAYFKIMSYIIPHLNPHYVDLDQLEESAIAFDISKSVNGYLEKNPDSALTPAHILAFTQRAWRIDPERANSAKFIFSVVKTRDKRRQIVGVFERGRNGQDKFFESFIDGNNRYCILLEPAKESDWNRYVGLFLPDQKQGEANPVHYYQYYEQI